MKAIQKLPLHAISMAFIIALLPEGASASNVTALQADEFVNSIGLNVHLDSNNYTPWSTFKPLITGLGVRHIRQWYVLNNTNNCNGEVAELYATNGIMVNLGFSTFSPTNSKLLDPSLINSQITQIPHLSYSGNYLYNAIESLEGPNEYDNSYYGDPNWAADLVTYQNDLYTSATGDNWSSWKVVVAPPLCWTTDFPQLITATGGAPMNGVEVGNAHCYNGANPPQSCTSLQQFLEASGTLWPAKPLYETENGYTTIHTGAGVSVDVQARWTPRMLLGNWAWWGISRTYIYELIDEEADSGTSSASKHYGLLYNTLTKKPLYTELQNLITILSDPGSSWTPGAINWAASGQTSNLGVVTMEKRSGYFFLVAWIASSSTPVSQNVVFTFPNGISSAELFTPRSSSTGTTQTISNNTVTLSVPDEPIILMVK